MIENVKNRKVEINKRLDHGEEEESVCKKNITNGKKEVKQEKKEITKSTKRGSDRNGEGERER